jgi:hypothetical protein
LMSRQARVVVRGVVVVIGLLRQYAAPSRANCADAEPRVSSLCFAHRK